MSTFSLKNLRQLFDKYAVACTKHGHSCQKYDEDFFQILWPSQKTQTLIWPNHTLERTKKPSHKVVHPLRKRNVSSLELGTISLGLTVYFHMLYQKYAESNQILIKYTTCMIVFKKVFKTVCGPVLDYALYYLSYTKNYPLIGPYTSYTIILIFIL